MHEPNETILFALELELVKNSVNKLYIVIDWENDGYICRINSVETYIRTFANNILIRTPKWSLGS